MLFIFWQPSDRDMSVLLINQAILISSMQQKLLFPMQGHLNNILVNNMPKFLVKISTVNDHSVITPSDDDIMSCLQIPLNSRAWLVTSLWELTAGTLAEYESVAAPKFHLYIEAPDWDPRSPFCSMQ